MIVRPLKILLPGAALLAACGGETPSEKTPVEEGRDAQGEVVGGTISDAMIPIDRLRSQSPAVRPAPRSDTAQTVDTTAEPEEEPAAEPQTEGADAAEPQTDVPVMEP
jgi:nitrous oxide reductase accessory protein NosL